jgi:hypothetical protein
LFNPTKIKVKIFKKIEPEDYASEAELRETIKNKIANSLKEE